MNMSDLKLSIEELSLISETLNHGCLPTSFEQELLAKINFAKNECQESQDNDNKFSKEFHKTHKMALDYEVYCEVNFVMSHGIRKI